MSMKEYVVVEFTDEEAIEVVHRSWILNIKEEHYCYWPILGASMKAQTAAKPDVTTWSFFPGKVLASFDTYRKAVEHSETASARLPERDASEVVRPLKKIKHYHPGAPDGGASDSVQDGAGDGAGGQEARQGSRGSMDGQTSLYTPTTQHNQPETDCGAPIRNLENIVKTEFCFDSISTPIVTVSPATALELNQAVEAAQKDSFSASFQAQLLIRLEKLEENQREILQLLRQQQTFGAKGSMDGAFGSFRQPASTVEELQQMCAEIKDPDTREHMSMCLSSLGGKSVADNARRIMEKVASNAVWEQYSFKGRKGKHAFVDIPLANVLINACMQSQPAKQTEVDDAISDFLRYAPGRKGGSKYKARMQPDVPFNAEEPWDGMQNIGIE